MKRLLQLALIQVCCFQISRAQTASDYSLINNLNPKTPTASQFTKYTELPVSEYTGIADISVPLYQISEDGVTVPLTLTYHASGNKVNEDASWVGLGWDLTVGSIVQQVNDMNDFEVAKHLQSDYVNSGTPGLFPTKYNYCHYGQGPCSQCSPTLPTVPIQAADGIQIYTDQWATFAGNYTQNYMHYFEPHTTFGATSLDSEPDIFTASFCGYYLKFLRDTSSGNLVVMNRQGFKVTHSNNAFQIIAPTGVEYDFALRDTVLSKNTSQDIHNLNNYSTPEESSNIFMLTKIITVNKKVITFNYAQTPIEPVYHPFSQKAFNPFLQSTYSGQPLYFCEPNNDLTPGTNLTPVVGTTIEFSTERYTYLSSITFPKGTISFSLSSRNDIKGGLKLDSMSVNSPTQKVKSYKLNYGYFDATAVGGHLYHMPDSTSFGPVSMYRLKLLSVQDNSGATHAFTYNATQLPARNSLAIDYWGYYNGDLANRTLIPNATQFSKTNWTANSDNHSANITYAQAGILTQIKYPTGGSANFVYELNQFNNYWVPDYSTSTNTISSGEGLRIKSVTWNDADGTQLKKTNYSYSVGLAALPINFFRQYDYRATAPGDVDVNLSPDSRLYEVYESDATGSYTANPFASISGVGYSQVTKTDVDISGNNDGKTVSNFFNRPDLVYNSINVVSQLAPTLPSFKDPIDTAENGSLKSELIYGANNKLLSKTEHTYLKTISPIYYGARIMGFGYYVCYYADLQTPSIYHQSIYSKSMVCYYPLFDFETLQTDSKVTEYFNADSMVTTNHNDYDSYHQLLRTYKYNSTYIQSLSYYHAYTLRGTSGNYSVLDSMVAHNRLTDIVQFLTATPNSNSSFIRHYTKSGQLFLASQDTISNAAIGGTAPNLTSYDQYDLSNGNILQYSVNTVPTALLWDYNKEYVVAEAKNALYSNIACTSFEADGTGRWKFSGTPSPDPAAPAGEKVYNLSYGNIYRDSLNTTLTYVVSYWSNSGAQTVSGSTSTKTGRTFNGYTYYEHTVPTPASGTITVSGTSKIDELRLYPNTAQMKSYTYAPLVGVTSEDNEGGNISYYEYDYALRLLDVRDQYKYILKAYCYNFAGQPTSCGLAITYSSQPQSQSFTKNNCGTGNIGQSVLYSIPSGKYTSTMSPDDANKQALADIVANGQAYANANGGCTPPPVITNIGYAGTGPPGSTMVVFTPITGCTTTAINWTDITTGTPSSDYGGCTSPRTVGLTVGHDYKFTITCYANGWQPITSAPYSYHCYN